MQLWCVVQWRRVDVCVTDGHCSAPMDANDKRDVALCLNGRVMGGHHGDVSIVDAVSGVALPDNRYDSLFVDTSGMLLWLGADDAVVASSGPHSAGRTLADVRNQYGRRSVCVGVAFSGSECQVLRFDLDPAPAVEPDRKASAGSVCDAVAL